MSAEGGWVECLRFREGCCVCGEEECEVGAEWPERRSRSLV